MDAYARASRTETTGGFPPAMLITDADHHMSMNSLRSRLSEIREEKNTDRRIMKLKRLNSSLPADKQLQIPSLITNAYIRRALDVIEERMKLAA
jgi:hypothetical protein